MKILQLSLFIVLLLLQACTVKDDGIKITLDPNVLQDCNIAIQNAIVLDHISPPVASRRYYYSCVAAYEALVPFYRNYVSTANQLNQLKALPSIDTSKGYCIDLCALVAHSFVAQKVVYFEDSIRFFRERMLKKYKETLPKATYTNSVNWGETVGKHIIAWSKTDSFLFYRGKDNFLPGIEPGNWQTTAPDNASPIEPNWNKVRTALLPSASFIPIVAPEKYNTSSNSRFYTITKQVLDVVAKKDSNQLKIAKYWDDSPNASEHIGHITIQKFKVSPAGHWLSIFTNVANQQKFNLMQIADGYLRASAVMFDAFIICWDTKYKTNYLRPQTAIRQLMDKTWLSPIQTPPFPEYPSGHSVVSSSAANLLQTYFGAFSFVDNTEEPFGLGTRKFNNFLEAANEACISRLYGGIHFTDGIENGKTMGASLAQYHLKNLKTKRN